MHPSARTIISLLLNVVSSVGVIFINKRLVFMAASFPYGTCLTIFHFIVSFLGCVLFAYLKYFEWRVLSLRSVLSISLAFCGYVVFNNMSLLTNSVALYQISKILCTPVIVAIEAVTYGKRESGLTLVSLIPVCGGIIVTVYAETAVTLRGVAWALAAVVANSFYTVWGKTRQQELKASPMQLLSYQAPLSAAILCLTLPAMEPMTEVVHYRWTCFSVFAIGLSCLFAFGVNFSFFLFVGQTSPLTMNVVGYLKTCLVFVGGFLFFDGGLSVQTSMGIVLTMIGLALYSYSKLRPAKTGEEV